MIAGIDEAGKGCVLGPLVVAGVCSEDQDFFKKIGVKDSKKLSHKKRVELYEKVVEVSKIFVLKIWPEELDKKMCYMSLNEILFEAYSKVILNLKPKAVYVDSFDVFPERLSSKLKERTGVDVFASHRADDIYPIVSAASIVAKVEREIEIEKMKKIFGDFGSGYSSDPKTREFLKKLIKNGNIPPFVRKKWKTFSKLSQSTLEFW
ncbi:MAG: ribonuclease HII [Archaeoglobaceae archaeon]|nr:ribonuclease HII [Archaeoglobaceae archaeon]MCX8151520.1 ribonuclease HII [Archaeoglobaceae archaeon]MDW8013244.1 ribonuclease HII [Archaeoglobaceae archaeon]